ncbi:MAG TPA: archease [Phycisphaerales bacterium]|nr:archease [Phycisphaerales bacterium]
MWEHFQHIADVGIRGIGRTIDEAFAEGAYALTAVILDPDTVRPDTCVQVHCEADDLDLLFADWLNTLVYEMDVRKMVFGRFEVEIDGTRLSGRAWGEPFDADRHTIAVGVKAATYMELKVYQRDDGLWGAQCVVDV